MYYPGVDELHHDHVASVLKVSTTLVTCSTFGTCVRFLPFRIWSPISLRQVVSIWLAEVDLAGLVPLTHICFRAPGGQAENSRPSNIEELDVEELDVERWSYSLATGLNKDSAELSSYRLRH